MSTSSIITVTDLNNGELSEVKLQLKLKQSQKFIIPGQKMYDTGVEELIKALTKTEALKVIEWHRTTSIVGKNNIFMVNFRTVTKDMDKVARSKFKRKLLDSDILLEYGTHKRLLLNPFMFLPRIDKAVDNSQYLTQQVWIFLTKDKDLYKEHLLGHIKYLFED